MQSFRRIVVSTVRRLFDKMTFVTPFSKKRGPKKKGISKQLNDHQRMWNREICAVHARVELPYTQEQMGSSLGFFQRRWSAPRWSRPPCGCITQCFPYIVNFCKYQQFVGRLISFCFIWVVSAIQLDIPPNRIVSHCSLLRIDRPNKNFCW